MKTKTTLSVSDARKNIFEIVDKVQKPDVYYTLTERGKPKAVILSAEKFEYLVDERNRELLKILKDGKHSKNNILKDAVKSGYVSENCQVFPKIFVIRDESKVVYLSSNDENLRQKKEDLIKCQLYVKLVEQLRFPVDVVEYGRYVKVNGGNGKRYIEADIIINDRNGNAEMIFEVGNFDDYEKNSDKVFVNLFELADSLTVIRKPRYIVYYSRIFRNGKSEEKISVVDYTKFNSFLSWKKSGRTMEKEIPSFE